MGRYYNGDIKGKFWVAVQDSDDADHFGVCGEEMIDEDGDPSGYLSYHFTTKNIPDIEIGIQICEAELGEDKVNVDAFFEEGGPGYMGYNNQMLSEYLGVEKDVREILENYARLKLGKQILEYVNLNGSCSFRAEL